MGHFGGVKVTGQELPQPADNFCTAGLANSMLQSEPRLASLDPSDQTLVGPRWRVGGASRRTNLLTVAEEAVEQVGSVARVGIILSGGKANA